MNKFYLLFQIIIFCFSMVCYGQQPDSAINLALLPDAVISGSVTSGRGNPIDILFNPASNDYAISSGYNEYGTSYNFNLGTVDADNGFEWRVEWTSSKNINYLTFGGVYPNQPQPNTVWRIEYLSGSIWTILEEGVGGWIDSGIYVWDNTSALPIHVDGIRVRLFSDGINDLVSIHLRGRGGISQNIDDSATTPKACLIQLLPYDDVSPSAPTNLTAANITSDIVELNWNSSTDNIGVTGYKIFQDNTEINTIGNLNSFTVSGLSPSSLYQFAIRAIDANGNLSPSSNSITVNTTSTNEVGSVLRINAGGAATSFNGKEFAADQYYDGELTYVSQHVTNSEPFKSIRYSKTPTSGPNMMKYDIPLVNGQYRIILHFLEIYYGVSGNGGVGNRVFDVILEGKLIEDDLDLADRVGPNVVYSPSHIVDITDGMLTIDFEASVNDPIISAIEILEVTSSDPNPSSGSVWEMAGSNLFYNDGNVGIGTSSTGEYLLAVDGPIRAKEIKVETANWPDYVFKKEYKLHSLEEIQNYIEEKGHLPNIPSSQEMESLGLELGVMNRLLLEKIEELTLYILQNEKNHKKLEFRIESLKQQINSIR